MTPERSPYEDLCTLCLLLIVFLGLLLALYHTGAFAPLRGLLWAS